MMMEKRRTIEKFMCLLLSVLLIALMMPEGMLARASEADATETIPAREIEDAKTPTPTPKLVTVSGDGLPAKGLILKADPDEKKDSEGSYPGFFVKLNPCGEKSHNTQPDNYMSSALATCMFIYKYDEASGTYVKETGWQGPIESYADTADLSHSYFVRLSPNEAAAFVPKKIGESDRTGREPRESDRYCFRYEIAMSAEQSWYLSGVKSEGDGMAVFGSRRISGGYITSGDSGDHRGNTREVVVARTKLRDDGVDVENRKDEAEACTEEELMTAGLRIKIGDIPDKGIRRPLALSVSVPSHAENGEGGFGFCKSGAYRESSSAAWTYPIRYETGGLFACVYYRKNDDGTYSYVNNKLLEVEKDKSASLNINAFHPAKGDILAVVPVSPDYASPREQNVEKGTFRPSGGSISRGAFLVNGGRVRKFSFAYGLSMAASGGALKLTGEDGTEVKEGKKGFHSSENVSDAGKPLQKVTLSVEDEGNASAAGLQDNGLPNYGLLIEKNSAFPAELYVAPKLSSGEAKAYYAIEDYKKKDDGTYEKIEDTVRLARVTTRVHMTINAFPAGTIVSVRRIVPDEDAFSNVDNDARKPVRDAYELTDNAGNIIYPDSASDTYMLNPCGNYKDLYGALGRVKSGGVPNADYQLFRTASPDTWDRSQAETVHFTALTGNWFSTDLLRADEQVAAVRASEESGDVKKNISIRQMFLPDTIRDGEWPDGALVVTNKDCTEPKNEDDPGANFLLNISQPADETYYHASTRAGTYAGARSQILMSHLYKREKAEDGSYVWKKEAVRNDQDYVNSGEKTSFQRITLSSAYFYGIHAHLREGEAMVVMPSVDVFDLTYWMDMTDGDSYDVIPSKCTVPSGAQHLRRTYFAGSYRNDRTSDGNQDDVPKAAVISVATAKKNVGSSSKDGLQTVSSNVVPLKVNLFDYDFGEKGHFVKDRQTTEFHFSYDPKNEADADINVWHTGAFRGIVGDTLKDGLPVFSCTTPFSLFDEKAVKKETNGGTKKVYKDVDFDFLYDKETSRYSYNSAMNAAVYSAGKNHVYEYTRTLGIDGWDEKGASFFPFNSFEDDGVWGTALKKNEGTYLIDDAKIDDHFGLAMTQTFRIPEDGRIHGQDMVFHFSGDDDAWLFVDGKLILDMGGIHERVSGEVNFTEGTWQTQNSVSPYEVAATESETVKTEHGTCTFAKGKEHTFSFFYLERGGTLSDLSMDFNLPVEEVTPTPTGTKQPTPTETKQPTPTVSGNSTPSPTGGGDNPAPSGTSSPAPTQTTGTATPTSSVTGTVTVTPTDTPRVTPTPTTPGETILNTGGRSAHVAYSAAFGCLLLGLFTLLFDRKKKHR